MRRSRRKTLPPDPVTLDIEALSHDGRGLAHVEGKTVFVVGALPGETVCCRYTRQRRKYDEAEVCEVLVPSAERVEPRCPHFGVCGGCSLQHLDPAAQIAFKQQSLIETLQRIGRVAPGLVLPPLVAGSPWGYRRKARLGVKFVAKKGKVLVGFRERGSSFVTDLSRCEVLHPRVGELIGPLSELIGGLSIRERVPQIEMSMGSEICVLVFRVLDSPSTEDVASLEQFGRHHGIAIYVQEGGPETVQPLGSTPAPLAYGLTEYDLIFDFLANDFTQVNLELNQLMVHQTLELLDPQPEDRVLDLYCGLGNFSLPSARLAAMVTGVEGDAGLVARARANAERNGIDNIVFYTADLYGDLGREPWLGERFDKLLLDPPRTGALEILRHLPQLQVRRIVYISCYPGTLARDADELVNNQGYRLSTVGVMDMFPHTAHVESIALFER